ncbi:MAG: hypothetical protein R3F42_00015 [Pseudomonadota bacterium]
MPGKAFVAGLLLLCVLVPTGGGSAAAAGPTGLRFDGLYWSGFPAGVPLQEASADYLRFYATGDVLSISVSGGQPEQIVSWFKLGDQTLPHGTFRTEGDHITFVIRSESGAVEYAGTSNGRELNLEIHSRINGYRSLRAYAFLSTDEIASGAYDKDYHGASKVLQTATRAPPPVAGEARDDGIMRHFGTVAAVEADRISLRSGSQIQTFIIDASTAIVDAEARPLTIQDLIAHPFDKDDRVSVRTLQARPDVAIRIQILALEAALLSGTLLEIGNGRLIVNSGGPVTVPIDDRTRFADADGKPLSPDRFAAGDYVTIARASRTGPALEVRLGLAFAPR